VHYKKKKYQNQGAEPDGQSNSILLGVPSKHTVITSINTFWDYSNTRILTNLGNRTQMSHIYNVEQKSQMNNLKVF